MRDVNENLGNQLTAAAQMSQQLKKQLAEGDNVVRRLSKIAIAARPSTRRSRTPADSAAAAAPDGLGGQGDRRGGAGIFRPQKV